MPEDLSWRAVVNYSLRKAQLKPPDTKPPRAKLGDGFERRNAVWTPAVGDDFLLAG